MLIEWSEERIEETIRLFRPDAERLGQDFTREDAIESLNNMVALFECLIEIDQRLRKEEMPLKKLAKDCLKVLIDILRTPKQVANIAVPGWYTFQEHPQFRNENFILTMPDGVIGCLSTLSIAAWEGMDSPELIETIKLVSSWLLKKKINTPLGPVWPHTISLEA